MSTIRLRYPANCRRCEAALDPGSEAIWDRTTKSATCVGCVDSPGFSGGPADPFAEPVVERGIAGASARAEYERRSPYGGDAISAQYPRIGTMLRRVAGEPQHVEAWLKGSVGEERLGGVLDRIPHAWVLHDRAVPASKANIDHIVIVPSGVFVIDAKRYKGKIAWSAGHLRVNGRDQNRLGEGILRQKRMIEQALCSEPDMRVVGVLCFVEGSFESRPPFGPGGFVVHSPRTLRYDLERSGGISFDDRQRLAGRLSEVFPPASQYAHGRTDGVR